MSRTISERNLHELLSRGEGTRIEFKLRPPAVKKLARTICAFANTEGGDIVIGISDKAEIVGVDEPDEAREVLTKAATLNSPEPEVEISRLDLDRELSVVVCSVRMGNDKPYRITTHRGADIAYIRTGSSVLPLPPRKEARLADEDTYRTKISLEPIHRMLLDAVGRKNGVPVKEIAKRYNLSRQRVKKALVSLLRSGLVVEQTPGKFVLR